jgi:tetratricopeptide (TPR) repeat protein
MLGNQYFMARNYRAAQDEFELAIKKDPTLNRLKKKLIICYTQTGKVKQAIDLFIELISEHIELIIDTDPIRDDCPCPDLVEQIEKLKDSHTNSLDYHLILGIVWLYCDVNKSIEYFIKARQLEPADPRINKTIQIIENYLQHQII